MDDSRNIGEKGDRGETDDDSRRKTRTGRMSGGESDTETERGCGQAQNRRSGWRITPELWSGKNRVPLPASTAPPPRYGSRGPAQSYRCINPSVPPHTIPSHPQSVHRQSGCHLIAAYPRLLLQLNPLPQLAKMPEVLILLLQAALPPPMLSASCAISLDAVDSSRKLIRQCGCRRVHVCLCLAPLGERVRMCDETACTSVENMCVSEGVSEGERLSGNIHVCTSTLAQCGGFLELVERSNIFTGTLFAPGETHR